MIEYVPNKAIQTILDDPKSYYRQVPGARMKWEAAKRVLEISGVPYEALLASQVAEKLKGFRFCSDKPVLEVPFHGHVLPVSMFDTRAAYQYDNTLLDPNF